MRLIDADKFILALMDASLSSVDEDTILDLVDSIPTVDAVPVVRCKGCEHLIHARVNDNGFLICDVSDMEITPDDFCSCGERKDDHHEDYQC